MSKLNKPTTIKEIARKLKISPSTVSRALNDHPSIGLVTTMRVKKMAEELNYEPNQTAIFFKQRKTYTIGVVLPNLSEPFFSAAISAIEDLADQHHYTVILGQSLDNPERQMKIVQTFKKHRVDGVLMSLAKNSRDLGFMDILASAEIPVVFFDVVPDVEGVHKVQSDLVAGVHEAVDAFVSRGHREIAMINGPENLLASTVRTQAFKEALEKNGITFEDKYVVHSDLTEEGNRAALDQICAFPERPSAVLSCSDFITLDVMKFARQKGIGIGQEMHFISFANYPLWKYIENPPLGNIEQYPDEQGRKAAEILFEILQSKEPITPQEVTIPTKLVLK
ncbi:LacI family transcriptional regulator [Sphingobacterium sp. SGG-5]|uniref:LacI family DNA-binding transcriptional regulator n=1 Tax=Sphingobacterium sp. SGG-5 TaxID=2710881 RepID=UPI0013EA0599|nr:LacI family DNA-binding transcriptional regulator [Sphingobacterium sp. SGG-5]NGM60499.1 LacI family transcriptional regulator [Sphingobacterium sp. SGG-5]